MTKVVTFFENHSSSIKSIDASGRGFNLCVCIIYVLSLRISVCIVDIDAGELELPEELPNFPYEQVKIRYEIGVETVLT